MSRTCTICTHKARRAIDEAIASGEGYRAISCRFSVGREALRRHAQDHLPAKLVKAAQEEEAFHADQLLAKIQGLEMDARKILDAAEGDPKIALGAIRELRGVFDLLGRLAIAAAEYKRLNPPPVDLSQSPEWIELQGLIVAALRPFPEARLAVVDAIAEAFDEGAART